jgi:Na+-translocating ferredoxin:NAD+ oxidoreductase RnfC subunit
MPKVLNLDEKLIMNLACIQCTVQEIAATVGCSDATLYDNYFEIIKKGWESGKASLRREQWKAAMNGNTKMLIWLGRYYLGQKEEKTEEEKLLMQTHKNALIPAVTKETALKIIEDRKKKEDRPPDIEIEKVIAELD